MASTALDRLAGVAGNTGKKVLAACRTGIDKAGWEVAYGKFQTSDDFAKHYIPPGVDPAGLCHAIEKHSISSMINTAKSTFHQAQGEAAREAAREAAPIVAKGLATTWKTNGAAANGNSSSGAKSNGFFAKAKKTAQTAKSAAEGFVRGVSNAAQRQFREKELTEAANMAYSMYVDAQSKERGLRIHLRSLQGKKGVTKETIEEAEREVALAMEELKASKKAAENAAGEAENIGIVAGLTRYRYHGGSKKTRKHRRNGRKQTRKQRKQRKH